VQAQPALSSHADAYAAPTPVNTEALPSTGNITVNINSQVPPNMHELLATISRGVLPSNAHDLASSSNAALQDILAGGDVVHDHLTNQSHIMRPHIGFSSRKTHRPFSQLSSKYKSSIKSSNKVIFKRARNLSL